jgi:hypothetical protein
MRRFSWRTSANTFIAGGYVVTRSRVLTSPTNALSRRRPAVAFAVDSAKSLPIWEVAKWTHP